jgi:hypothetical protein
VVLIIEITPLPATTTTTATTHETKPTTATNDKRSGSTSKPIDIRTMTMIDFWYRYLN